MQNDLEGLCRAREDWFEGEVSTWIFEGKLAHGSMVHVQDERELNTGHWTTGPLDSAFHFPENGPTSAPGWSIPTSSSEGLATDRGTWLTDRARALGCDDGLSLSPHGIPLRSLLQLLMVATLVSSTSVGDHVHDDDDLHAGLLIELSEPFLFWCKMMRT